MYCLSFDRKNVSLLLCMLLSCLLKVNCSANCAINKTGLPADTCAFDLRMRGAQPKRADQYLCSGYNVADEVIGYSMDPGKDNYIVSFEPLANANKAHHILVYGCSNVQRRTKPWACGSVCGPGGSEQILFAWAKNAEALHLPPGVGRLIGPSAGINYIVLQVHYVAPLDAPDSSGIRIFFTQQRQQYRAGIYLMLAYSVTIPPNTKKTHADISCKFNWDASIIPFGFRTHAHSLGKVISGYKEKDGVYTLIGKGNPQWPQAFYPVNTTKPISINPGDNLLARCTYDSTVRDSTTHIGATSGDEMCNFYMMYYMNASDVDRKGQFETCAGNNVRGIFDKAPADSDTPLPRNEALEDQAVGHYHHSNEGEEPDENEATNEIVGNEPTLVQESRKPEIVKPNNLDLKFISEFGQFEIGQVGGLAVNDAGELHIFHRGSRVWDALSFDYYNVYQQKNYPVAVDAVIILNKDGSVKKHFGKNRYFLPHGLSLDQDGNIWLTDVALHQVFRIPKGKEEPDMTLGMRFEPGTDDDHFCKPSDVAVLSTGEIFVSDGYCNSRIMKFDKNGYYVKEWGTPGSRFDSGFPPPGTFNLPHSLALAEDKNLLCVADRENGRIQCFNFEGKFVRQMHHEMFGKNVYALEYCPKHGGVLFAVNGPIIGPKDKDTQGFTVDINNGNLLSTWNIPAKGLSHPHDLTVDTERHLVYVGELNPSKVWKFEMSMYLLQANTTKGTSKSDDSVLVSGDQTTGQKISTEQISMAPQTVSISYTVSPTFSGVKPSDVVIPNNTPTNTFSGVEPSPGVVLHNETVDVVIIDSNNPLEYADEGESFAPSLIIGTLLVVPVVLLILITILVRLYNTGNFERCRKGRRGTRSKFNLGNLLNSHKGFDRLSTEDDDHDLENALDDSDNEEFSIVRRA